MPWMPRTRPNVAPLAIAVAALAALVATTAASPAPPARTAAPKGGHAGPAQNARTAEAILHGSPDHPKLSGSVLFQEEGDHIWVVAKVQGVERPGRYGFHLHENGRCAADPRGFHFTSAGGHFNPASAPHACLDAAAHHAGDLGNLTIEADGTGRLEVATEALALAGPRSVIGRSIVLDARPDDCKSQPAGSSGARIACGVVVASPAVHPTPKPKLPPH